MDGASSIDWVDSIRGWIRELGRDSERTITPNTKVIGIQRSRGYEWRNRLRLIKSEKW